MSWIIEGWQERSVAFISGHDCQRISLKNLKSSYGFGGNVKDLKGPLMSHNISNVYLIPEHTFH